MFACNAVMAVPLPLSAAADPNIHCKVKTSGLCVFLVLRCFC